MNGATSFMATIDVISLNLRVGNMVEIGSSNHDARIMLVNKMWFFLEQCLLMVPSLEEQQAASQDEIGINSTNNGGKNIK